jgi:hypothetical protein
VRSIVRQIKRHEPYEEFGTVTSLRPGKQGNLSSNPGWEKRYSLAQSLHPTCVDPQASHTVGTIGPSPKDIATDSKVNISPPSSYEV